MISIKKYIPWIITTVLGLLALYFGMNSGVVQVPVPSPYPVTKTDTLHDTTRVTGTARLRTVHGLTEQHSCDSGDAVSGHPSITLADSSGDIADDETHADIDTTITINTGDSSWVTIAVSICYGVETHAYRLWATALNWHFWASCAEAASSTWQWIERALSAALIIASHFIK